MPRRNLGTLLLASLLAACAPTPRATGDLGLIIERAASRARVVETTTSQELMQVTGLGDLSHASAVFSRDERYAFVFGRDGGLSKVDMLTGQVTARVVQAGNSIGGAISQDGRLVAVANYEPGGVKVFRADTLEPVADIPAVGANGKRSRVVGLEDAADGRFVFSLFDAGEIWVADFAALDQPPHLTKFPGVGNQPYDALVTTDGRWYIAGLFGEDGLVLLDLWNLNKGPRRILDGYGKGEQALPVYKMPHLEGWAAAGRLAFLPAIGHHEVLVVDMETWKQVGKIPVKGQPVFVMARPDGRQVWVNFALPENQYVQVIDVPALKVVKTLEPGKGVLHLEFTPRGEKVWLSLRDENRVEVYDTRTLEPVAALPMEAPSGIFFTPRAHRIGL